MTAESGVGVKAAGKEEGDPELQTGRFHRKEPWNSWWLLTAVSRRPSSGGQTPSPLRAGGAWLGTEAAGKKDSLFQEARVHGSLWDMEKALWGWVRHQRLLQPLPFPWWLGEQLHGASLEVL